MKSCLILMEEKTFAVVVHALVIVSQKLTLLVDNMVMRRLIQVQ